MNRRRRIVYAVLVYILVFVVITFGMSSNFFFFYSELREFCLRQGEFYANFDTKGDIDRIPRHIHQMFFNITDKVIPKHLETARQTWVLHNPGYNYTLWDETMVLKLIKQKYQGLLPLYNSYGHWVRRADVARYVILYEFGGLYVDLDIAAEGTTEPLLASFKNTTGVVLYYTKPVGVSNDFMISKSRHPFFKHVICGLEAGNLWYILPYLTTLMTTGPGYLYSKYRSYEQQELISVVDESLLKPFLRHKEGGAWHGIDGKIIWKIYVHRQILIKCAIILICSCFVLFILRRFKYSIFIYYDSLKEVVNIYLVMIKNQRFR